MYKIVRTYSATQTYGDFIDDKGKLLCKTLELPWLNNEKYVSCIPEGTYDVVQRVSKKYGIHWHITNVEDRDLILIHNGNYAGSKNPISGTPDIKGCVMVGVSYGDINKDTILDITSSVVTMNKLRKTLPKSFQLTITKK